jgi:hypothetical protein
MSLASLRLPFAVSASGRTGRGEANIAAFAAHLLRNSYFFLFNSYFAFAANPIRSPRLTWSETPSKSGASAKDFEKL